MSDSVGVSGAVPTPDDSETQAVVRLPRKEQSPAPTPEEPDNSDITLIDTPLQRVRHPADLIGLVLAILGIVFVIVLAIYANSTTEGVTQDVRAFGSALRRVFGLPISVLEAIATLLLPALVVTELAIRRAGRQVVESIAAWLIGLGVGWLFVQGIELWASPLLVKSLTVTYEGDRLLALSPYVMGLTSFLTTAGRRGRRRMVTWSWNTLWIVLIIAALTDEVTLLSALLSVLVGRTVGLALRYLVGVASERAYGDQLIAGIRSSGIEPSRIIRVHNLLDQPGTTRTGTGESKAARENLPRPTDADSAEALDRSGDHRVYAVTDIDGNRCDVLVLDGDRQVLGFLARTWRAVRLRGLERRGGVSLRQAGERAALLAYAARAAGVRTPKFLGLSEVEDSMVLAFEHPDSARSFRDLSAEEFTDEVLTQVWEQLLLAHRSGLAHRQLSADTVLVDKDDNVWITAWESGDISSSELARRMDLSHALTMLALRVGAERAVASAAKVLSVNDLESMGPLIQGVALPSATRSESRAAKKVLQETRQAVVEAVPSAELEPVRLVRFGIRTVLMITATVIALIVVATTLNLESIIAAVRNASPWWTIVAFVLGLLTHVGASLALIGFAPMKLPFGRVLMVEVGASFVKLVAPAGIGPAALYLRFLNRRGVRTSLAVATVALVQVAGFVVTVLLLVVFSVVTGNAGVLRQLPDGAFLWAIGIIAVAVAIVMAIPGLRQWIWKKASPPLKQTWPRLVDVLGQPKKLALGIGGNLIMTIGYVACFGATLAAFGASLPVLDLALVFLVSNTLGSLIPTPGGIGAVEGSIALGLTLVGIDSAVALSAAVLFRVLTYWARAPLGWLAMNYLQRQGDL